MRPNEMHHMRWAELPDPPTISSSYQDFCHCFHCQRMEWASLTIIALMQHIYCSCSPRIMEDEVSYSCMYTNVKC